jgi:hypothetical protein
MRRLLGLTFLLGITLLPTQAAIIVNVTFDEFGNGLTDYQAPPHAMPVVQISDPTGGVAGQTVLTYILPFTPTPGQVQLCEVIGTNCTLSDVIRFTGNLMIFYSDNGDGVDSPADTGLPQNVFSTNVVTINEIGPEGNNGATYVPVSGQPGYFSTDFTATYNIVSDGVVPEPSTMVLFVAGILGLGTWRRFRPNR